MKKPTVVIGGWNISPAIVATIAMMSLQSENVTSTSIGYPGTVTTEGSWSGLTVVDLRKDFPEGAITRNAVADLVRTKFGLEDTGAITVMLNELDTFISTGVTPDWSPESLTALSETLLGFTGTKTSRVDWIFSVGDTKENNDLHDTFTEALITAKVNYLTENNVTKTDLFSDVSVASNKTGETLLAVDAKVSAEILVKAIKNTSLQTDKVVIFTENKDEIYVLNLLSGSTTQREMFGNYFSDNIDCRKCNIGREKNNSITITGRGKFSKFTKAITVAFIGFKMEEEAVMA